MKCDWIKINNDIVGAKYKGKESQLFKLLENKFGLDKAVEMYEVSRSTEFLEVFGAEEPTLKQLTNYITNQNKSTETLSTDDRADLLDSGVIDTNIFYDEFGFFTISPKKLKTAGYSNYEIKNIENNKEAIKSAIERLNNTENIEMSETDKTDLEFLNEFNIFGKLRTFNPQKEIFEKLAGIKDQNEFNIALSELEYPNFQNRVNAEELFKEMSQYKKAEVYIEYEGEIRPQKVNETAITLPIKVKDNYQGQNLSKIRLDVLQENEETTRKALKQIEKDLIGSGLDVIGLSEKPIDEDLINFLDNVDSFYNDLNSEKFAQIYDNYFSVNTNPKTTAVKKDDKAVYIELNTTLSEEEVYEKASLIKSENNLWIKTAKEDLGTLYNNLRTHTEKYPKDMSLEEYVQKQIAELDDFKNAENAEVVMLYKMYFDVETTENWLSDNTTFNVSSDGKTYITDKNDNLYEIKGNVNKFNGELLVNVLENDKVIAKLDLKRDLDESYYALEAFVLPEYQRKGIATAMYDYAVSKNIKVKKSNKLLQDGENFWKTKLRKLPTKKIQNFTGNAEYLTTEYVADFNIEMLKEKAKNSAKYKNFYSNFDINEKGIYLKNTDDITMQKVELYADENLRNYSLLSKQMPDLTKENIDETKQTQRDNIVNNPQNISKYQGQLYKISDQEVIIKNETKDFIRIGQDIYENVAVKGTLSQYTKLERNTSNYNIFGVKKLEAEKNLNDYNYLETTEKDFISTKQYLTKQEKDNQDEYEC